jgi:hypothetical protein
MYVLFGDVRTPHRCHRRIEDRIGRITINNQKKNFPPSSNESEILQAVTPYVVDFCLTFGSFTSNCYQKNEGAQKKLSKLKFFFSSFPSQPE